MVAVRIARRPVNTLTSAHSLPSQQATVGAYYSCWSQSAQHASPAMSSVMSPYCLGRCIDLSWRFGSSGQWTRHQRRPQSRCHKMPRGRSETGSPPIQLWGVGEHHKLPKWHQPSRNAANAIFSITVMKNIFEDHNYIMLNNCYLFTACDYLQVLRQNIHLGCVSNIHASVLLNTAKKLHRTPERPERTTKDYRDTADDFQDVTIQWYAIQLYLPVLGRVRPYTAF